MSGIERAAGFRVFIYIITCTLLWMYAEPRAVSRSRLGARVYLYLRPKTRIRVFKAMRARGWRAARAAAPEKHAARAL